MEDLRQYRLEVELRDGTPAIVRAIRPEDKDALRWGFGHLSPDAVYHRFFQAKRELTEADLRYLTELDFVDHVALVVEVEVDGEWRLIGVARFVRVAQPGGRGEQGDLGGRGEQGGRGERGERGELGGRGEQGELSGRGDLGGRDGLGNRAEIAFTVGQEFQGRGVATLLLEHLAGLAWGLGFRVFEAEVMPENRQMLEVFQHSGLAITERVREGVVHVELALG